MQTESFFFVLKNRHLKHSLMYIEKRKTLFYHVYDKDFEIRRKEPKLIIGAHCLRKNPDKNM